MNENLTVDQRFHALLKDFCADVGLEMDDRTQGIEFEADQHVVLIAADPRQAKRLLIEVSVTTLEETSFELLATLHRVNDAARLEHDWVITIGVDEELRLHTQRDIDACRSSDLQALLSEGIERAQALHTLCMSLSAAPAVDSPGLPAPTPDFSALLNRG